MNSLSGWYEGVMPHPSYNKCQGRCGLQLLKDLRDASQEQKEKVIDHIKDSTDMSQTSKSDAASLDDTISDINNMNSDESFQFKNMECRIEQFVDIIIDKDIGRYQVTNMLDSISTKDIESIVGQFTSNIMETYIDEAQMTDSDESI
jgi:hypothetical protein